MTQEILSQDKTHTRADKTSTHMKITLPFFLSSKFGKNVSPDGSAFDVALEQPIDIPAGRQVHAYVQSADVPYVMANIAASKQNNTMTLSQQHAALGEWYFKAPAIMPGATQTFGQKYKMHLGGLDYTYQLTVTPTQIAECHTILQLRDTLNTLSTAAMIAAHPTLVGQTAPILSPSSATPIVFHNALPTSAATGYNTSSEILAMAHNAAFVYRPDAAGAGEVLAAPQADFTGLVHGLYHGESDGGTVTHHWNLLLLYENPYFTAVRKNRASGKGVLGFYYGKLSYGTESVGRGDTSAHALPMSFFSQFPAGAYYQTITIPDGLYDCTSLNTAVAAQVATLAASDVSNGTHWGDSEYKFVPNFDRNRVQLSIQRAGDGVLFAPRIANDQPIHEFVIGETNDSLWYFDDEEYAAGGGEVWDHYHTIVIAHVSYHTITDVTKEINSVILRDALKRHGRVTGATRFTDYVQSLAVRNDRKSSTIRYNPAISTHNIDWAGELPAYWLAHDGAAPTRYGDLAGLDTTLEQAVRVTGAYQGVDHTGTFVSHSATVPYIGATIGNGMGEILGFVDTTYPVGNALRYNTLHATVANQTFIAAGVAALDEASTLIIGTDLAQGAVMGDGSVGHHGLCSFQISGKQIGEHVPFTPTNLLKIRAAIDGLRITTFRVFLTNGHGETVEMGNEVYSLCLCVEYDDGR